MLKAVIKVTLMPNYLQFITEFFPVGSYIFSLFYFFWLNLRISTYYLGGHHLFFTVFYVGMYIVTRFHTSLNQGIEVSVYR